MKKYDYQDEDEFYIDLDFIINLNKLNDWDMIPDYEYLLDEFIELYYLGLNVSHDNQKYFKELILSLIVRDISLKIDLYYLFLSLFYI